MIEMDQIIEKLFTDPFFVKVGLVLVVLISLSILKKLVKVVVTLVLVLLLYGWYVSSTGTEPIKLEDVQDTIEDLKNIDEKKLKKAADKAIKDVKKKVEKGLN
jgi:apolipoprotein N-acyltransferase